MRKAAAPARFTPFEFRFERLGGRYFVTNAFGGWAWLTPAEFGAYSAGEVRRGTALFGKLAPGGFLREAMDMEALAARRAALTSGSFLGPSLHILVVTLKCNHACVYCRAVPGGEAGASMTPATARRCVDTAFASPRREIAIEFQGGEALLNWPAVRAAVLHALEKNSGGAKDLSLSVVTNLTPMDEEKFRFLSRHGVGICTSLDGPAGLHDANRRWLGGSSFAAASRWLRRASAAGAAGGRRDSLPSALMTTTRLSLGRAAEIVGAYRKLGLGGVFIRPLSPIGYAKKVWGEIGYSPAEFAAFYREALAEALAANRGGEKFVERNAALAARRLLRSEDPDFLDLRSPCGAATGQLAYNWNGDVYTCDEGRMTAAGGDPFFRLGNVRRDPYGKLVSAPAARACALASCLEGQPACSRCAFAPLCGVCPVHNYETQGSPWGDIAAGSWCATQKGIFAAVLEALEDPRRRRIIEGWLEREPR